jgi:hypothetical protein
VGDGDSGCSRRDGERRGKKAESGIEACHGQGSLGWVRSR